MHLKTLSFSFALVSLVGCATPPVRSPHDAGIADAYVVAEAAVDARATADAGARLDAYAPPDAANVDAAARVCDDSMIALPDPSALDGSEATLPATCASCPHFTGMVVTPSATTASVVGTVTGSTSCHWYLVSPSCGGTSGAFGPDPEFGMFSITLPLFCGTNRLQLVCEGPSGQSISTRSIDGPSCGSRDVQITLAWGETSRDQELHLVRQGAHLNDAMGDCTWFTCVHTSPDWGVIGDTTDDPHKDVDNTGTFGPENIFLSRAADGRYEVMVEYWGSGTADAPNVTITLGGRTVWHGMHTMNVHDVWNVGTIVFPASTFTPVDTIIPCQAQFHASGSQGCALPIP